MMTVPHTCTTDLGPRGRGCSKNRPFWMFGMVGRHGVSLDSVWPMFGCFCFLFQIWHMKALKVFVTPVGLNWITPNLWFKKCRPGTLNNHLLMDVWWFPTISYVKDLVHLKQLYLRTGCLEFQGHMFCCCTNCTTCVDRCVFRPCPTSCLPWIKHVRRVVGVYLTFREHVISCGNWYYVFCFCCQRELSVYNSCYIWFAVYLHAWKINTHVHIITICICMTQ